ncbi:unnamed protein product [Heligmosomoides polygyrus]|uniref:Transposase n=1 Tax=Heligmosomoides polygyrus TaxID=6339 RepID=A0A183FXS9_HELPZ|nr:unnamed protein product [Heligmosomoides polygyrus]
MSRYGSLPLGFARGDRWYDIGLIGEKSDGGTMWSRRESGVDNDRLRRLVESDPRRTTRELAQDLGVHYATIARYPHQLGKVHKLEQWVPHDLTARDHRRPAEVATQLQAHRVVKGEQPEPEPKEGPRLPKIMHFVWWDYEGVTYYVPLARNETPTADLYSQQLDAAKIAEKRPNHGTIRL